MSFQIVAIRGNIAPMEKRGFLLLGSAVMLGSVHACTYELPTTANTSGSSSSTTANASSSSTGSGQGGSGAAGGHAGMGGNGHAGMGGKGGTGNGGEGGGITIMPTVQCGEKMLCNAPDECCTDQAGTYTCAIPFLCGMPSISVACDGPEDCPGMICCGQWAEKEMRYHAVSCLPTCDAPNVVICHADEPDSGCPEKRPCNVEVKLGPGYGFCSP